MTDNQAHITEAGYGRVTAGYDPHVTDVGGYPRAEWGPGQEQVGGYTRAV